MTAALLALGSFVVLGGFAAWMIGESSDAKRQRVTAKPWVVRSVRLRELNRKITAAMLAMSLTTAQAAERMQRFAHAFRQAPR